MGQLTVCLGVLVCVFSFKFFLLISLIILGTIYLLIVIACASLKMTIRATSNGDFLNIANNIRCPDLSVFNFVLFTLQN